MEKRRLNKLNDKQLGVVLSLMESNGLIGAGMGVYTKEIFYKCTNHLIVLMSMLSPDTTVRSRIRYSELDWVTNVLNEQKLVEQWMFRESLQEQKKIRVFDFMIRW